MTAKINITESNTMQALGNFLVSVIDAEVINGLDNRVPEPSDIDFAVMTPITQKRLSMNVETREDCSFLGSIDLQVLTVDSYLVGEIIVGSQLFGPSVAANTLIEESLSPTTFQVSKSQTVTLEKMSSGNLHDLSPREVTIQVDIHGPESSENSMIVESLFRSGWGFNNFADSGFDIRPLYCTEPQQIVFNNAEKQSEKRWSIDCTMQVNPIITVPQQFMDTAEVVLVEVDSTYPAS